jgi:hypothetical protein
MMLVSGIIRPLHFFSRPLAAVVGSFRLQRGEQLVEALVAVHPELPAASQRINLYLPVEEQPTPGFCPKVFTCR